MQKIDVHNKWDCTLLLLLVVVIIIAYLRARTLELEQQQPGVEGELRRLLEKPGKTLQTLSLVTLLQRYSRYLQR